MKIKFLLAPIVLLISFSTIAQSYRTFNFFNYDPKLINPAFAGLITSQDYQVQYSQKNDYINNSLLMTAIGLRLKKLKSGLGFIISDDILGSTEEINGSLLYNYQIEINSKSCLSIGTQLKYSETELTELTTIDSQSGAAGSGLLKTSNVVDFAAAYRWKKLYVGLSTANLIQKSKTESFFKPYYESPLLRSYSLYAQYEFNLSSLIKLQPSALVQADEKSSSILLNEVFVWNDRFLLGATESFYNEYTIAKLNAGAIILKRIQFMIGGGYTFTQSDTSPQIEALLRYRVLN